MRQSVIYDQDKEMVSHKQLTENTGVTVHICDPRSLWLQCASENSNGLVRRQLPKGAGLCICAQEQLDILADQIKNRPRKSLWVRSQLSVYRELFINNLRNLP